MYMLINVGAKGILLLLFDLYFDSLLYDHLIL